MVSAKSGLIITCDIPIKQFILKLDDDADPKRFIIANLDDTHVLVQPWAEELIRERLEALYNENEYTFIK